MKKILSKIIAPISCLSIATPISCINTSCGTKHLDIENIKLSSRYEYIYPDQKLKIKASVSPASASKEDLQWEIIDENQLGFSIDQEGWLTSPKTYPTDEPFSIFIKCTSKLNPQVNDIYSILATTDKEHELLGFAGGITYLNRDGSIGVRNIEYTYVDSKTKIYYIEGANPLDDITKQDGIDLYVGRSNEYIDFKPVFKTGNNDGMMFDLVSPYGYSDKFNCVSWVGYKDNDVTKVIPQFVATNPTYRKQFMEVTFTADPNVLFRIAFDVYQNTSEASPAIFSYNPTPEEGKDWQGENEHSVDLYGDGQYNSQILTPTTTSATPFSKRVGDIYIYRKPFENVNTLTARWEPDANAPDIFTENGKPNFSDLEFGHHLPNFDWYDIAILHMTYTIDRKKSAQLDYENYFIGRYCAYDIDDTEFKSPLSWINFYVSWVDVG